MGITQEVRFALNTLVSDPELHGKVIAALDRFQSELHDIQLDRIEKRTGAVYPIGVVK